jgi:hypothetical protein
MWLLKTPFKLIAMINFADMFLQDESGHIHFLDLVAGELKRVADSPTELQQLVAQKENRRRWFLTDLLTEIEHAGFSLSPGQCFGFKKPPALGGKIELSNVEIVPLEVHVSLMGQIHQQVKHYPPGTRIKSFQIA